MSNERGLVKQSATATEGNGVQLLQFRCGGVFDDMKGAYHLL